MRIICDLRSTIMPPLPLDPMDYPDHLPLRPLVTPVVYSNGNARKEAEDDA